MRPFCWRLARQLAIAILLLVLSSLVIRRWTDRMYFLPWRGVSTTPADLGLKYEDVFFETQDGVRLHGWWLPAEGPARGTVVHAHGNAANLSNHIYLAAFLPREGFNTFVFDWRGFGQSEGSPSRWGLRLDLHAAIDAVRRRPEVGPDGPVALYGQSIGASHAIVVAAERDDIVCLVAESAFTSHRAIAADAMRGLLVFRPLAHAAIWPFVASGLDPIDYVARVAPKPQLFIHGESDDIIPPWMTDQLFARAREPKYLVKIEGYGHLNGPPQAEAKRDRVVADFLHEQLGSPLTTDEP